MSLYEKLCNALQDNEIDELGLLPVIPEVTDLPPESAKYYPLVVVECKLGIELSALSVLLKESHEHFVTLSQQDKQQVEQVTRVMVLLKPDNYTAMNRRKEFLASGLIDPKKELALIDLIFTLPRHSKSSIAWYHRQWILTNCDVPLNSKAELDLCAKSTALYPRNYYAWTYRNWILEKTPEIAETEYKDMCTWIMTNISDFSGFHYLQQVMKLLHDLQYEQHMWWLNDLIIKYPGHESLWCHRRFCSSHFQHSPKYNAAQHKFVADILEDRFQDKALTNNNEDILNQKQFALKFGLWHSYIEKSNQVSIDTSLMELYSEAAPRPNLLDQEEH